MTIYLNRDARRDELLLPALEFIALTSSLKKRIVEFFSERIIKKRITKLFQ